MVLQPVVEGYLALGQVHMLAGSSGAGKTSFVAFMLKRILEGQPLFGHKTHRPPFIGYMAGDRTLEDALGCFEAAGVDCSKISLYGLIDDESEGVDADIALIGTEKGRFNLFWRVLLHWFGERNAPPGSLLIVDGLVAMLGIDTSSRSLGKEIVRSFVEFCKLCRRKQWTVILIHQGVKQRADSGTRYRRPQDRISGSMFLEAGTSTQMHISQPEDQQKHHEFFWGPHRMPPETHLLRRGEHGEFVEVLETLPEPVPLAEAYVSRTERILGLTPADGTSRMELVATTGWPKNTLNDCVRKLLNIGLLVEDEHGRLFRKMAKEES